MNEQELISQGEDAAALLGSEPFNRVVNKMVEQCFHNFVNSKPDENKERGITYYQYRALVDVVNTLKQHVQIRDEILAKNVQQEGDTSQEGDMDHG
jgi:hypothetical protein